MSLQETLHIHIHLCTVGERRRERPCPMHDRRVAESAPPIFEIEHENGTEVLIPMIDDFIKQVDRDHHKIILETPSGLIDMYLS